MKAQLRTGAAFAILALAATSAFLLPSQPRAAEEAVPLSGKVTSSTGEALAGIPVKARRAGSNMTVAVYSDAKGEYSFPTWSDVTPMIDLYFAADNLFNEKVASSRGGDQVVTYDAPRMLRIGLTVALAP